MSDPTGNVDAATPPPGIEPARTIGPYRLISRLGQGGVGVVYHAVHQVTGRAVALKVIDLNGHRLGHHLEQVTHEAMAMATLRHPHVVTCYSFGEDGRHLYLALELIPGGDTVRLVERSGGRLDEATIRRLAEQCAAGLAAIHQAGLVHRDIKPSNILLDEEGRAKLADFGLVCYGPAEGSAATAMAVKAEVGTPAFMPPEAITGESTPDIRGDLYSLGVTMHYWAVGSAPFKGANGFTTMQQVLAGAPPSLSVLRPDLSTELVAVISTAMQRQRERRHQDPQAFLRALRGEPAPIPPGPTPPPAIAARASGDPASPVPPRRSLALGWLAVPVAIGVMVVAALRQPGEPAGIPAPPGGSGPGIADGPAASAQGDGYRLAWLGDPLVRFQENGAVSYSRAGQRLHLAGESWLDGTAAEPLTRALAAGGDLSLELAIHPANLTQEGPARIFSIGITPRATDLMIGQSGSRLEVRVRTTATNPDGTRPHLVSDDGVLDGGWQHLVFVRSGHRHLLYVDGALRCAVEVPGDLSAWDAGYPLCLGNDHRGGFSWNGSCERLVLAAHPWSADEVETRYRRWAAEAGDPAR
jgi:hypothetical protein